MSNGDNVAGRFQTKDSGARAEYASGMVRDTQDGKARFDLIFPKGVPYSEQMVTRFAELMARGAAKYQERNWELAQGQEELDRYHSSALRHLIQWLAGETDEDHAAAVMFNVMAGETVKFKMRRELDFAIDAGVIGLMDSDRCSAVTSASVCAADDPRCVLPLGHSGWHTRVCIETPVGDFHFSGERDRIAE